jgi:iron-sulfur cluster repair protein YtfE (RIC family)
MNALELLKADHEKVQQLFKKAEDANPERQRQLFEEIKQELETHTHIEETVFYPAVREADELKDMVLESLEEHKQVKTLLREMENLTSDSEMSSIMPWKRKRRRCSQRCAKSWTPRS